MAKILTFKTVQTQLESIFLHFCEYRDGGGGQSAIFTSWSRGVIKALLADWGHLDINQLLHQ